MEMSPLGFFPATISQSFDSFHPSGWASMQVCSLQGSKLIPSIPSPISQGPQSD